MTNKKLKNSITAGSKKNAAELRKLVAELFAAKTKHNGDAAQTALDKRIQKLGRDNFMESAVFKSLSDTIVKAMGTLLNTNPPRPIAISDGFYDDLLEVLTYPFCESYDNWALRTDVTDAELLAVAGAIKKREFGKLEGLRGTPRHGFVSRQYDYDHYKNLLNILNCLCLMLAHLAKHFNSFAAGHCFLMNSSRLRKVMNCDYSHFEEGIVEALVMDLRDGLEEMAIAADYLELPPWGKYCREFVEENGAALTNVLAKVNRKGAK